MRGAHDFRVSTRAQGDPAGSPVCRASNACSIRVVCLSLHTRVTIYLKLDMCCTVMCTVCGACHRYATCCAECSMLTAPPAAFPLAGGAVTKDK